MPRRAGLLSLLAPHAVEGHRRPDGLSSALPVLSEGERERQGALGLSLSKAGSASVSAELSRRVREGRWQLDAHRTTQFAATGMPRTSMDSRQSPREHH